MKTEKLEIENLTVAEWIEKYFFKGEKTLLPHQLALLEKLQNDRLSTEVLISYAGTTRRREDFKNGKPAETLREVLDRRGFRKKQCHNCAFLPNSEEMKAYKTEYPSQVSTILENIDLAVEGCAPFEPFFCHQGMKTEDGGKSFKPPYGLDGLPKGFPICAGWAREANKTKTAYDENCKAETEGGETNG